MENENLQNRIKFYEELVPEIFPTGFPENFRLMNWALSDEVIARPNIEAIIKGNNMRIRPIGTMDVEFLDNGIIDSARKECVDLIQNYPCGLNCPGCFSQEEIYSDKGNLMKWQEVMKVIDDARTIGLNSIKFLGPGELFQNSDLFDILKATRERDLTISIFTKGAELGCDELAKQTYGFLGIQTAKELVQEISDYDNVKILLGFNSFFPDRQNKMVGSFSKTSNYRFERGKFVNRGIADYTSKRDQALKNLVDAGFNDPKKDQRLTLINTPVSLDQIDEVPDMYVWAAKRNMPMVISPTMESGPRARGLMKHDTRLDPEHEKLINLYTILYSRAINEGILTLNQIKEEGISSYMGTSSCNQIANGLFMRLNGQVQMCPGKSDQTVIYGNIHETPISQIWFESPHYQMGALKNNWCTAKIQGMPQEIQKVVMEKLESKFN